MRAIGSSNEGARYYPDALVALTAFRREIYKLY